MPTPGCIEHDFYIHAAIRKARRRNLPLYYALMTYGMLLAVYHILIYVQHLNMQDLMMNQQPKR